MGSRPSLLALLLALALLPLASGCSTYRNVPLREWEGGGKADEPSRAADAALAPGDRVRLRLRDGCVIEGRLAAVTPDSLVMAVPPEVPPQVAEFGVIASPGACRPRADDGRLAVPVAEIVAAERLRTSLTRSVLVGLGAGTFAALLALMMAFQFSSWPD